MKDGSKLRKDTHLDESRIAGRAKQKNHLLLEGNEGKLLGDRLDQGKLLGDRLDQGKLLGDRLDQGKLLEGNLDEGNLLEGNLDEGNLLVRNAREQRPEEKFATLKPEDGSKRMVL